MLLPTMPAPMITTLAWVGKLAINAAPTGVLDARDRPPLGRWWADANC